MSTLILSPSNSLIENWSQEEVKKVQFTLFPHHLVNAHTVYFKIRATELLEDGSTKNHEFEIHYHPTKQGNWLHAKKTAKAKVLTQISINHKFIDIKKLKDGREAWCKRTKSRAPSL